MEENHMVETGAPAEAERAYTRAEVDALVSEQLAAAREQAEAQMEAARQAGRDEAERLGRMSAEERLNHERASAEREARQRTEALDAREAAICRRERMAEAAEELRRRELPEALATLINCDGGREAVMESIDQLDQVVRAAVQQGIDARLRQTGVKLTTGVKRTDASGMDDAAYYASLTR